MAPICDVDASNSCIPNDNHTLISCCPPLPTTTRGEPLILHGNSGKYNSGKEIGPMIVYGSGKLVIIRYLNTYVLNDGNNNNNNNDNNNNNNNNNIQAFVYRGHTSQVSCAKFSPSGCYVASGDIRGKLRIWSYDNDEHLCKLDIQILTGPIKDISWDMDSKRIAVVGFRTDTSSDCVKVIQYDTGVTCGNDIGQHLRGKSISCSLKKSRPMRLVSSGYEDMKIYINSGPPFKRLVDSDNINDSLHKKGSINCIRYSNSNNYIVSVGSDKCLHIYDGKTLSVITSLTEGNLHSLGIYSCCWSSNDKYILTCSTDGTIKLIEFNPEEDEEKEKKLKVVHTWNIAAEQLKLLSSSSDDGNVIVDESNNKVPIGGMQMGCTFIKDDIPVSISLNGNICILPKPTFMDKGTYGVSSTTFLYGHNVPIATMTINPTSNIMYTGDTDGIICSYDIKKSKIISKLSYPTNSELPDGIKLDLLYRIHTGTISCMATCCNKLLSAGWDDVIRITDITNNDKDFFDPNNIIKLPSQPNIMSCGTKLVVIGTVDGLLLYKDGIGLTTSNVIPIEDGNITATSICVKKSNDRIIYVGCDDCKIRIYEVYDDNNDDATTTGLTLKHTISNGHLKPIYSIQLSNDESKIASGDIRDICIWDIVEECKEYVSIISKGRWCFHMSRITSLCWSNDDTIVASGSTDDSIYLWNINKKMKRIHYPYVHRGGITGLSFINNTNSNNNNDGYKLLSVGNDSCINQWDVTDDIMKKFS